MKVTSQISSLICLAPTYSRRTRYLRRDASIGSIFLSRDGSSPDCEAAFCATAWLEAKDLSEYVVARPHVRRLRSRHLIEQVAAAELRQEAAESL